MVESRIGVRVSVSLRPTVRLRATIGAEVRDRTRIMGMGRGKIRPMVMLGLRSELGLKLTFCITVAKLKG